MSSARVFKADAKNNALSERLDALDWEYIALQWIEEEMPELYDKMSGWAAIFSVPIYIIWVLLRLLVQWSTGFSTMKYPQKSTEERRNSVLGLYGRAGIGKSFIVGVFADVTDEAAIMNSGWRSGIAHDFDPHVEAPLILEPENYNQMIEEAWQRGGLGTVIFEEQS